jgi:hypothetical protein
MYGIYANIGGILMVNVTIYSIHGSYGIYNIVMENDRVIQEKNRCFLHIFSRVFFYFTTSEIASFGVNPPLFATHRSTTSIDKGFTAASGRYMVRSPAQLGLMGEAEQDRLLLPKSSC